MVLVNYSTRELTAKLVYYGPGLCGKTTNLQYIYENLLPKDRRGKMVSLATETDRTLFFDFLPLELGTIRGLKTRLQLYTVPGQVHYNATRKIVLKGADGIVFVADSQPSARESNIEAFKNMKANLAEHGLELRNIPHVLQLNKRDLPAVMSIDQMAEDLNEYNAPFFEAIAVEGIGVEDALKGISKLVLKNLAGRFQAGADVAAAGATVASASIEAAPPPVEAAPPPVEAAPPPVVTAPPPVVATPAPAWPAPAAAPPATPAPPPVVATPAPAWPAPAAAPPATPAPPPIVATPAAAWPAPAAAPPATPAPPPVVATPAPAWPAPAATPSESPAPTPAFSMPSGDLEDLMLARPAPETGTSDVFGFGRAPDPSISSDDLEDQLLAGPMTQGPEPVRAPEAESAATFASAGFDALSSGDTIISEDAAAPMTQASPMESQERVVAPTAVEAELLSGDTILSESPSAADFEFEAGLLSGDTMLSGDSDSAAPSSGSASPTAAGSFAAAPSPGADDEIPLSLDDEIPLSLDDEIVAPEEPSTGPTAHAPGVFETPRPAVVDIPVALHLGAATPGEMVERVLRVPVEYDDASGTRRITLEVTLRFRLS